MTDAPHPPASDDDATSSADDVAETTPVVELVDPATVRRAPRFRAFLWAGAVTGLVIGFVVGLIVFPSNDRGWTLAIFVTELAAAGVLIGAVVAVLLDRRSLRGR